MSPTLDIRSSVPVHKWRCQAGHVFEWGTGWGVSASVGDGREVKTTRPICWECAFQRLDEQFGMTTKVEPSEGQP